MSLLKPVLTKSQHRLLAYALSRIGVFLIATPPAALTIWSGLSTEPSGLLVWSAIGLLWLLSGGWLFWLGIRLVGHSV